MNCTEGCTIHVGGGEHFSDLLWWPVMKIVLYRLVGGAGFSYTAVECIEK